MSFEDWMASDVAAFNAAQAAIADSMKQSVATQLPDVEGCVFDFSHFGLALNELRSPADDLSKTVAIDYLPPLM